MPENCWLLTGPWQTRFTGPVSAGHYYLTPVPAPGGRTTRVLAWNRLADQPSIIAPSDQDSGHPARLSYRNLTLFVDNVATPGSCDRLTTDAQAVPLALTVQKQSGWDVYLPVRMNGDDGLFVRTATIPAPPQAGPPLAELLDRMPTFGDAAGSHESWFFKYAPETEYEHKITLAEHTDIYPLARDIRNSVGRGGLADYRWEYRDDWQTWWFDNHLFAVTGPGAADHGYISFIPTLDGSCVLKRKLFVEDGFKRTEIKTRCRETLPTISDKTEYLTSTVGLEVNYLGWFRRIRFDITLENVDTGHIHSIMIDRCLFPDHPDATLQQLEIEYLRTRGLARDCEDEIRSELDQLRRWSLDYLSRNGVTVRDTGYLSKYTVLRRLGGAA